ncbi:hypothetical protein PAERUG_E6_London_17_VIM_2_12_12_03083 [Pseudomonas aeruginosa]|nr:hypothetical protein PAERUG_E6_London_17_VIM_2_12_12_03083 [Pseudomonas aeruginosa]
MIKLTWALNHHQSHSFVRAFDMFNLPPIKKLAISYFLPNRINV